MTKKPILVFLLIIPFLASAQDKMVVQLSKQLCKCFEKTSVTNLEEAIPCYEQMITNNAEKIYLFYKVESLEDLDFEDWCRNKYPYVKNLITSCLLWIPLQMTATK